MNGIMRAIAKAGLAAVLTAVLFVLGLATLANATTVAECHAAVDVVRTDLAGVEIGGNHPAQTLASLNSKLNAADLKLDQGKFSDATQKLTDFQNSVLSLSSAPKPKMEAGDAARLAREAAEAQACVQSLG